MAADDFTVRFWGVRGTIAAPGPATARYGGNTSCVEMRCGERLLIFDAGTGARALGEALVAGKARRLDMFFSHCHYDHIEGLPFFAPVYSQEWEMRLWAGHLGGLMTTEEMIRRYMSRPYFPIHPGYFAARLDYREFAAGESFDIGDGIAMKTVPLNHPDGATGYRVDYAGRSVCYVTDTEHHPGKADANVLALIADADIVIYDASYCDEEFARFVGYGHSTWQEGVRLCRAAGARSLVAFHHLPQHDDATMDKVADSLTAALPGSHVAREGLELNP